MWMWWLLCTPCNVETCCRPDSQQKPRHRYGYRSSFSKQSAPLLRLRRNRYVPSGSRKRLTLDHIFNEKNHKWKWWKIIRVKVNSGIIECFFLFFQKSGIPGNQVTSVCTCLLGFLHVHTCTCTHYVCMSCFYIHVVHRFWLTLVHTYMYYMYVCM